jgi:hypothetical protein
MPVLRSTVMRGPLQVVWLAVLVSTGLAALPPADDARAQAAGSPDSSLLVVFENDTPVARERSTFQNMGDSLVVVAMLERQFADEQGTRHPLRKSMMLVVDSRDLGLIRYVSTQRFDDHEIVRGLIPGDTAMTYYIELDGGGSADRVVQPPGRLFVMDSQLFTLFDVLSRSLATKTFTTRRVQVLALQPDSLAAPLATVTTLGADTVLVGRSKEPLRHYAFEDESARFELWSDRQGRLVRLTHAESGLRVERVQPEAASPARKPAAAKKTSAGTAH